MVPDDATRYELARDATLVFLARRELAAFAMLLVPCVLGFGALWFFLLIGIHTLAVRCCRAAGCTAAADPLLYQHARLQYTRPVNANPSHRSLPHRLTASPLHSSHRSQLHTSHSSQLALLAHRARTAPWAYPGRASPLLAERLDPGLDSVHGLRCCRLASVPCRQRGPPVALPPQLGQRARLLRQVS